jgi:hypothetical protein
MKAGIVWIVRPSVDRHCFLLEVDIRDANPKEFAAPESQVQQPIDYQAVSVPTPKVVPRVFWMIGVCDVLNHFDKLGWEPFPLLCRP